MFKEKFIVLNILNLILKLALMLLTLRISF
jgi:hypothetical protein